MAVSWEWKPKETTWIVWLRHQLIRLIVGKMTVIANAVFVDNTLVIDRPDGIVFNCTFVGGEE